MSTVGKFLRVEESDLLGLDKEKYQKLKNEKLSKEGHNDLCILRAAVYVASGKGKLKDGVKKVWNIITKETPAAMEMYKEEKVMVEASLTAGRLQPSRAGEEQLVTAQKTSSQSSRHNVA